MPRPEPGRPELPEEVARAAAQLANRFGRYVLVQELGRGGMGAVHRAWDTTLRRWVALKFLLLPGSGEDLERFRREARTAAALSHPNIASIYEVGEEDGKPYIAMQYVEGKSLQGARLPVRRACEVVRDVARALETAHRGGIIHRDLKPGNIVLDPDGRPVVLDFGLAKSLQDAGQLTASGIALGTPAYMSPEQAEGRSREVDERSDVYQLGAVLYELLTRVPPFRGDTVAVILRRVVEEDVVRPSKLARIPAELETIVLRALDKDPGRRYPGVRELADDLERHLAGRAVHARPTSFVARFRRLIARHRAAAVAIGALGLLAAGAFAYAAQGLVRSRELAERRRRADAHFERGEHRLALELYSRARELDPADARILGRLEECRRRLEEEARRAREAEARAAAEQARAAAREAARGPYERGRVELETAVLDLYRPGADLVAMRRRLSIAVEAFSEAIGLWREHPEAHYDRGRARILRGELEEADRDLARAVELRPDYAAARSERGRLLVSRYIEARLHAGWEWDREAAAPYEKWLEEARALVADAAFVAFAEGRLADCLAEVDRRLREKRGQEELWKLRGDTLWFSMGYALHGGLDARQAQILREALAAYTEALGLRANYYEARMMRGHARLSQGDLKAALEDIGVAHRLRPDDALSCWFQGKAVEGDPARSLRWYEEGLRHRPDSFVCRMNRAASLGQLGRLDEALEELERSLKLNPSHYYPVYLRGSIRSKSGRMDEAYEDFKAVTAKAPGFPSGWYNLGVTAYNTRRYREAVEALERALAAGHPDRDRIQEVLRLARSKSVF